jgi:thioredoxin 1
MKLARPTTASLLALLAAVLGACSSNATGQAPEPIPASAPVASAAGALPRLVFFMNPDGVPCQMQDRILREMSSELNARFEVVYYRTTNPSDLAAFGRYGIRSLPALLLTDSTGREIRRATPGIQSPEQIRQLLGG